MHQKRNAATRVKFTFVSFSTILILQQHTFQYPDAGVFIILRWDEKPKGSSVASGPLARFEAPLLPNLPIGHRRLVNESQFSDFQTPLVGDGSRRRRPNRKTHHEKKAF
jgi:hypothetical protein